MAVTAAVFTIAGGGRLNPVWFAGQDLDDLLGTWITVAGSGGDELVTARVYAHAFTYLADQAHTLPSTQRDRDKTAQWSAEQITWWERQARKYEAEADALTGLVAGPVFSSWEGGDASVCES